VEAATAAGLAANPDFNGPTQDGPVGRAGPGRPLGPAAYELDPPAMAR
jgi:hypothetical protein